MPNETVTSDPGSQSWQLCYVTAFRADVNASLMILYPGACPRVTTRWGSNGALSTSWSRAGPIPCPRSGFVYYVLMIKRFTIIFTEMGIKTSDIDKKIDKHPSYN